ncbi:MAG: hypothetical protein IH840_02135 [Candidatus Heimdallarchaeota archaeon]|nr:hypothetical protein [Candidatus Heimdallarchaeota archaeon]
MYRVEDEILDQKEAVLERFLGRDEYYKVMEETFDKNDGLDYFEAFVMLTHLVVSFWAYSAGWYLKE